MVIRRNEARYSYGISLADWIKFVLGLTTFLVAFWIMRHDVDELKQSFHDVNVTIESIRNDINQVKLTNAVLIEEYNNDKRKRIVELEKQLDEMRRHTK